MEPHDSHELALNRAFEERWQRRMERPRSVAALTALQYRERKKYELAWYKNETIQLSEQIEHLQNRLSFLMDQNTSLNLDCQKLRKRVAQLENLCRDQLKNLVSRPSKSANASPGSNESAQSSSAPGTVVIADLKSSIPDDEQSGDDIDPNESEESSAALCGTDVHETSLIDDKHSPDPKPLTTTTATVRRGIPIVKQRSPSGKTTIVAAATTSGHSGSKHGSNRNISYVSMQGNNDGMVHISQSEQKVNEHDYMSRKRILIPKRAISSVGNEGSKTLRIVRSVSSMSGKSLSKGKSDSAVPSPSGLRGSHIKSPANVQSVSSKRLSHNNFKSVTRHHGRSQKDNASPLKTPPEVIISDAESSDIEQHERLSRSYVSLQSQSAGTKVALKAQCSKRLHHSDDRPTHSGKRPKSSDDTTDS